MTIENYEVDLNACRNRQKRLLNAMSERQLENLLLTRQESIQWLTGAYIASPLCAICHLRLDGHVSLVLPSRKTSLIVAADEVVPYEEKWHSTLRDLQRHASLQALAKLLPAKLSRVGSEWSQFGPELADFCTDSATDVEELIFRLRRRKDPDEIKMMRRANDANASMYRVAREIVRPGLNELELYNALHQAAVETLREPLTYFGQDFRSNARGGAPRDRRIEAGELYILDLGVGFRGYYSDNARTLAVGGAPDAKQQLAWERTCEVLQFVKETVRPGVSCRELFQQTQAMLDQSSPWVFNHHLGHGVGLAPHEGPHLNPFWDDTFEVGDFFTAEPGLYHEELRSGIRLEENYLVTESGVEKVTDFPLEL